MMKSLAFSNSMIRWTQRHVRTVSSQTKNFRHNVGNAEIVYVIGSSGTGKTFIGDYLAVEHGFHHVDGDTPLKKYYLPEYAEISENFHNNYEYHLKGEDGPQDLWKPYYDELARLTLEAASSNSAKVVLSHATYRQSHRDYFIEKVIEGGASMDNITKLWLTIDDDVRFEQLYLRYLGQVPEGATLGDLMRAIWGWDGEGDMSRQQFFESVTSSDHSGFFQDCPGVKTIDVSARGEMSKFDAIDRALGLGERLFGDSTVEEIEERVLPIDIARDRELTEKLMELQPEEKLD